MTIDHITIAVSDYQKSRAFFSAVLAPLGITLIAEFEGWAGFGKNGKPEFWFGAGDNAPKGLHLAFSAANRAQVREFYRIALQVGGTDNGPPGIRAIYHPAYYGAFVLGPDAHNVEAVCHLAET